jgi:hypothetical protein
MRLAALAVFSGVLFGQEPTPAPPQPAVLEYNGKPLVLPFQCTEEDVQSAGLACSEDDPCPIYLELAAIAGTGSRLIIGGNIHAAAVTLFSALLASEDGVRPGVSRRTVPAPPQSTGSSSWMPRLPGRPARNSSRCPRTLSYC